MSTDVAKLQAQQKQIEDLRNQLQAVRLQRRHGFVISKRSLETQFLTKRVMQLNKFLEKRELLAEDEIYINTHGVAGTRPSVKIPRIKPQPVFKCRDMKIFFKRSKRRSTMAGL